MLSFHEFEGECRRLIQGSALCAEWSLEFCTDGADWIVHATTGAVSVFERVCSTTATLVTARELFPRLARRFAGTSIELLESTCTAI